MVRSLVVASLLLAGALGACTDGSDGNPTDDIDSPLISDPNVPFDPDVPDGVGTETDEGNNQGFESDTGGPVGNNADLTD